MSDAQKINNPAPISGAIQLKTNRSIMDLLFILILLFTFSVSSLVIVMIGANVYKSVVDDMQSNYDLRIPLSYIATKVRQHDESGAIHLTLKEGTSVLVLKSTADKVSYETWIYAYDHKLYEVLLQKGETIKLADGMAILPVTGLDLKMPTNSLLEVTSYDASGKTLDLSLHLRSN